MTGAVTKAVFTESISTFDGITVRVSAQGLGGGRTVVLLDALSHKTSPYEGVLARLQIAKVRTIVIASHHPVAADTLINILDGLGIPCVVLVGDRAEAQTAWRTTAHHPGRIIGLVVIDRGDPNASGVNCTVCETHCPPVLADTTALVGTAATKSIAEESHRHVRADLRIVELVGRRGTRDFIAQLSTEIVLRALSV